MKKLFSLSSLICASIFLASSIECMQSAVKQAEPAEEFSLFQNKPIEKWGDTIYDNAWQGASYHYGWSAKKLTQEIELSMKASKEQADREGWDAQNSTTINHRVIRDWIYTLKKTEETLLRKPFQSWTIEDIMICSTYLTRLTLETPGAYRTDVMDWKLRTLTDREKLFCEVLHIRGTQNKGEEDFLKESSFLFPLPKHIKPLLEKALAEMKTLLRRIDPITDINAKRKGIIFAAAHMHYQIVLIHPGKQANKRLGRLIMNIILAQYGIMPQTIENPEAYIQALITCLKSGNSTSFAQFMFDQIERREKVMEKMKPLQGRRVTGSEIAELFAQQPGTPDASGRKALSDVFQNILAGAQPEGASRKEDTPTYDELIKSLINLDCSTKKLTEAPKKESSIKDAPQTKICHTCKQYAGFKCSQCKEVWYCSKEHQQDDWKLHKPQCKVQKNEISQI